MTNPGRKFHHSDTLPPISFSPPSPQSRQEVSFLFDTLILDVNGVVTKYVRPDVFSVRYVDPRCNGCCQGDDPGFFIFTAPIFGSSFERGIVIPSFKSFLREAFLRCASSLNASSKAFPSSLSLENFAISLERNGEIL